MRRAAPLALVLLALGLAGCGGGKKAAGSEPPASAPGATSAPLPTAPAPPTTTAPTGPTLTSQADLEACNELETNIRIVSQLVVTSAQEVTHSNHPKDLARHTGDTRRNLLFAASVLDEIEAPPSLRPARRQLVAGLRRFAVDFGRAQRSVVAGSIAKAARQLVDRPALAEVTAATRTIDHACGA